VITLLRIRIILLTLSLLAVLAVGAVGASAASAAPAWTVSGVEQTGGGTETIVSTGGAFKLNASGVLTIECKKAKDTGTVTFDPTGKDEADITFEECAVEDESACEVTNAGTTKVAHQISVEDVQTELVEKSGVIYDVFSPPEAAKGIFVEIAISKCKVEKSAPVTGDTCAKVGPEAVKGTLTFTKEIEAACGVGLKLGEVDASLKGTTEQEFSGEKHGSTIGAK
jgi:hypothetical protein